MMAMRGGGYGYKGVRDLVTKADRASERMIVRAIRKAFPGHGIFAEEGGARKGDGEWEWIVDPLDGTTNYAHGLPNFAVSMGLARIGSDGRRRVEVAVVHAPALGETFVAAKGKGATRNGRPIRVSRTTSLIRSLLVTGFAYDRDRSCDTNIGNFGKLLMRVRDIRRFGAASLDFAYVACGRFDGFWELHLAPWDKAAGSLLVSEAGGRVTDEKGGDGFLAGPAIVATNGRIHEALRRSLSRLKHRGWGYK